MRKPSNKACFFTFLALFLGLLALLGGLTAVVDPYFHYHKPLKALQYRIYNERYQNDGIGKHFDYDAIITGTSMTQNFKTSELDALFGTNAIKVPFSGGGYKEINENLARALKTHPHTRLVVRGLDYNGLMHPADWSRYEADFYPDYLYDSKPYNDVKYLFNKSVWFNETLYTLAYTRSGGKTTTFDAYNNWMAGRTFGKEALLSSYSRPQKVSTDAAFSDTVRETVYETVTQNITALAAAYPDTEFYLFFTPYSILFWDSVHQYGNLGQYLDAEKYAIELMLPYENIHLFSFFLDTDVICNFDNYKDANHYGEWVNSQILQWMHEGHGELTAENYEEYCRQEREFYTSYDYDAIFTEQD